MHAGECRVITGPNGSGKSLLGELLTGRREPYSGRIWWPGLADEPMLEYEPPAPGVSVARAAAFACRVVSFEYQERLIARERREDESWIMHGATDPGTTAGELIRREAGSRPNAAFATPNETDAAAEIDALAERFGISHILDRGLRFLSTGEFRKTLLAAALVADPRVLLLDEPFDGLDLGSRHELEELVRELHTPDRALILVLNRARDLPPFATHVTELRDGRIVADTARVSDAEQVTAASSASGTRTSDRPRATPAHGSTTSPGRVVIAMRDVSVAYGDTPILHGLSWTVREGDRWMIHGPNGSGKSTLLSLINGDNPKGYGQEIELFGRRKGSGESVWEIKRRIGFVSGDLQLRFPLRATVLEAILSGFHDSIGLFEEPSGYEVEQARGWIERIGLAGRADTRLRALSFGQRRMVLIARAVVKSPLLLIADEPSQGLDDEHASQVLGLLDSIGAEPGGCMLYVTHNPDEELACLTHTLELVPDRTAGSRPVISAAGAAPRGSATSETSYPSWPRAGAPPRSRSGGSGPSG